MSGIPVSDYNKTDWYTTAGTTCVAKAGSIREAAKQCPEWEKGLKIIFPQAFFRVSDFTTGWYDDWF